MGCINSNPGLHAYYAPSGELVSFERPKKHSSRREYEFVSVQDSKRFQADDECYLLCTIWHESWLNFVLKKTKKPPGMIDNYILMDAHKERLRPNVKPKKDFRPINKSVWEFFFHLYGGGPVITLKVPGGFNEEDYLKGTWMKRLVFDQIVAIIHPGANPSRDSLSMSGEHTNNPLAGDTVAANNATIAANLMLRDLGKAKFEEAKQVQKEINQGNADTIAMQMNKDRGKNMLKEGLEKEKQQNEAMSHAIAHQFAENTANQKLKEAQKVKEQKNESQSADTLSAFTKGSLKKQFKAACQTKNKKLMVDLAARMLQNAWAGKKARKRVAEMKRQRQRLLEDGYARKLQSRYRAHLAKLRVIKLKQEKQRLKEEGCAIMLQSAWRIKQSRRKVAELKKKKQRLMEEGAALKLQSSWRIKQAKGRVGRLRADKIEKEKAVAKAEKEKAVAKAKKVILKVFLAHSARQKYSQLLLQSKHILVVHLDKAKNILAGDVNSSDPYVFVHVDNNVSIPSSAPAPSLTTKSRTKSSSFTDLGRTLSQYKSKIIYNTLNPVWKEDSLVVMNSDATSSPLMCNLVLTVMDKDNFSSDDFLGQSIVPLQKHVAGVYSGKTVYLPNMPLGPYTIFMRDEKGKRILPSNTENNQGRGFIDVTLRMFPLHLAHHGWMQRQSSQKISFGSAPYKPRYVVLNNGKLTYHEHELCLESARGTIVCSQVTKFEYGPDKNGDMTLHLTAGEEDWLLHWMEGESQENILAWLRKLEYACKKAPLNGGTGSLFKRIENMSKTAKSTTPVQKSGSARRGSTFFGGK